MKELLADKDDAKKEWLTSREVRNLLKISPGALQNLRITRKLNPVKVGGINFYRYSEIHELLDFTVEMSKRKKSGDHFTIPLKKKSGYPDIDKLLNQNTNN